MLGEAVQWLLTPSPAFARPYGMVAANCGLWARANRLSRHWADHEARCKAAILLAMAPLARRRRVIILGSGLTRDLPLAELSAGFGEVVLVDAVHLAAVRRICRRFANVRLVTADVTGRLAHIAGQSAMPATVVSGIEGLDEADLVISANCLSQLPLPVEDFLEQHPRRAAALPKDIAVTLIGDHIAALQRLACPVLLITDVEMQERDASGTVTDRLDLLRGHTLPPPDDRWEWPVAPRGEADRNLDYVHQVHIYQNFNSRPLQAPCP